MPPFSFSFSPPPFRFSSPSHGLPIVPASRSSLLPPTLVHLQLVSPSAIEPCPVGCNENWLSCGNERKRGGDRVYRRVGTQFRLLAFGRRAAAISRARFFEVDSANPVKFSRRLIKKKRRFAAFSPPGPVDVIELDIDGWYENALPWYIDAIYRGSACSRYTWSKK